ncbi:MAG: DEAD/DEAH box helicase, partial [Bacteroidales bacterium]|nr:DEAD/DEAH box helicase [Bacteroidales bacterium]
IKTLVLDEADEMLDMGFKEDLDNILSSTPDFKQTLLFSATMPDDIRRIAEDYMMQPMEISVGKKNSGAENVDHVYYLVSAKNRYLALKRVVDINPNIYGIVFCRTRKETQEVADKLIQDGYNADSLHGDLSQAQRDMVMAKFRSKHLQVLVATDVAARGIDVNDLTHIINYNLPDERETYIHRSGRTGRAGKRGMCITIVHTREEHKIREIEKLLKKEIVRKKIPDGKEICMIQLMSMIDKVMAIETIDGQIKEFLPAIMLRLQSLDREELIKRFVSTEFNRFLNYYKGAADINIYDKDKKGKGRKQDEKKGGKQRSSDDRFDKRIRKMKYTKFFITVGEKDGLTKMKLMDVINSSDLLAGAEVGKIEILTGHTFFEVDSDLQEKVIRVFKNRRFMGKRLKIEVKSRK